MTHIKDILTNRLIEIDKIKSRVEKSLAKAPDGALVTSYSHGTIQFFQRTANTKNKGKYIEKKNKKLISALAQKEYDILLKKEIERQEKQIKNILEKFPEKQLEEVYNQMNEEKKEYVNPHLVTEKQFLEEWTNVEYEGNGFHNEALRYTTERGEKVRSKSEKIIADKLYAMGIPYRYEYPIYLKGYETLYPDFTILNLRTREEILFEHFGLMNDPMYCEKAIAKIQKYAQNGYFLGKNLIITFELPEVPLDMNLLEQTLKNILGL